jgi:hypothetical protein
MHYMNIAKHKCMYYLSMNFFEINCIVQYILFYSLMMKITILLQNLSLFHLTFHPTLNGKDPIPPMWILSGNHEWFGTNGKVSTMIPPCTIPIHSSLSISINNPLCTHSSGNGPLNNQGLVVWMSSFPLGLLGWRCIMVSKQVL